MNILASWRRSCCSTKPITRQRNPSHSKSFLVPRYSGINTQSTENINAHLSEPSSSTKCQQRERTLGDLTSDNASDDGFTNVPQGKGNSFFSHYPAVNASDAFIPQANYRRLPPTYSNSSSLLNRPSLKTLSRVTPPNRNK